MDKSSARLAKYAWDNVLKTCNDTKDYPTNAWYLHVAAVESQLFIHAGQLVQSSTPNDQGLIYMMGDNNHIVCIL